MRLAYCSWPSRRTKVRVTWRDWCDEGDRGHIVADTPQTRTDKIAPAAAAQVEPARAAGGARTGGHVDEGGQPGDLPIVRGLDAGMVSLREFPLRRWYYADPHWYYHAPALEHRLSDDAKFYELVDPPLRPLCRAARAAGLSTTPSCAGHFYMKERFARLWATLQRDADGIRGGGLAVCDSESGAPCVFQDPAYVLPWTDFDAFFAQVDALQRQGYLGLAVPPRRAACVNGLVDGSALPAGVEIGLDPELTSALGQPLIGIRVSPANLSERERLWAAVTRHVQAALATTI
jgi:hypothetical protein